MRTRVLLAGAMVSACTGDIVGGGDDDSVDGDAGGAALMFAAPSDGAAFERDALDPLGRLTAEVAIELEIGGGIARVEVLAGDAPVGEGTSLVAYLRDDGIVPLRAIGYDAGGAAIAQAGVDVTVATPSISDCHGWLDLYQLDYTLGPANEGVDDPVTVTTPINGMVHRYTGNAEPRATFFMHCELALALAKAAPLLRERDVVELVDIGVYNYRCIGGGTPPDCPNGISQHAYAKAIDMAGFTTSDDTFYSVNDDWVIDAANEPTCDAPTESDKDAFLHEIVCAMKAEGIWNIALTPNYNDAHRNHFHVDLTSGSDFIRRE
jgi:hypothetical protein